MIWNPYVLIPRNTVDGKTDEVDGWSLEGLQYYSLHYKLQKFIDCLKHYLEIGPIEWCQKSSLEKPEVAQTNFDSTSVEKDPSKFQIVPC